MGMMNTNSFIRNVKKLTSKNDWFHTVIYFKSDCKYHFDKCKGANLTEFKYQEIDNISRDILSNLNTRINGIVRRYNKYLMSNTNKIGYECPLYDSMDDIFHNGIVTRYLKREDLRFIGCIEFSSRLSNTNKLEFELAEDTHLGTHVHLFIRNRTGLSSEKVVENLMDKVNNWSKGIERIAEPLICDEDFYNTNQFILYLTKQPELNRRVVHNLSYQKTYNFN